MKSSCGLTLLLSLFAAPVLGQNNSSIGCYVEGECIEGVSVGIMSADTVQDCVSFCKDVAACEYFTYSTSVGVCVAYGDCPRLSVDQCSDCVSGDASCPAELCGIEGKSKIFKCIWIFLESIFP